MGVNLDAVRAAVAQAKVIAEEFHTATAKFYVKGDSTPVLVVTARMKKPKPSSFDAGNQTEWSTKRIGVLKLPLDFPAPYADVQVTKGMIVQLETEDGDPTINKVNFTVMSALTGQFAAEREVTIETELTATPRIT